MKIESTFELHSTGILLSLSSVQVLGLLLQVRYSLFLETEPLLLPRLIQALKLRQQVLVTIWCCEVISTDYLQMLKLSSPSLALNFPKVFWELFQQDTGILQTPIPIK